MCNPYELIAMVITAFYLKSIQQTKNKKIKIIYKKKEDKGK